MPVTDGLVARGSGDRFHLYLLSDTTDPAAAAPEEARCLAFADARRGRIAVTYRRRPANTGFKAGNIRDFCERFGGRHDFGVVLDADSVLTADAMLRLVRIMQADPDLGSLQSLV